METKETNDMNRVREAVALFRSPDDLLTAVDALETNGFDRAALSIPSDTSMMGDRDPDAMANNAAHTRAPLVFPETIRMARTALASIPVFLGVSAGLVAGYATGTHPAGIVMLAMAGGVLGGGLGSMAAKHLGKRHVRALMRQCAKGGIPLWVQTNTQIEELRAQTILAESSGEHVHMQTSNLVWGADDIPLSHANPDPFLQSGPGYV